MEEYQKYGDEQIDAHDIWIFPPNPRQIRVRPAPAYERSKQVTRARAGWQGNYFE